MAPTINFSKHLMKKKIFNINLTNTYMKNRKTKT